MGIRVAWTLYQACETRVPIDSKMGNVFREAICRKVWSDGEGRREDYPILCICEPAVVAILTRDVRGVMPRGEGVHRAIRITFPYTGSTLLSCARPSSPQAGVNLEFSCWIVKGKCFALDVEHRKFRRRSKLSYTYFRPRLVRTLHLLHGVI